MLNHPISITHEDTIMPKKIRTIFRKSPRPTTQCFEMGDHEDTTLSGTMCIAIELLLVVFATNIIIITRN